MVKKILMRVCIVIFILLSLEVFYLRFIHQPENHYPTTASAASAK